VRGRALPVALLCAVLAAGLACSEEAMREPGIATRVFVDRTEARVGDPIGVTVEVETPLGFGLEKPAPPPPDERFLTEGVELLDPLLVPQGTRHRLLWTLRARRVGEERIPELELPLVRPDGEVLPLPVGGTPLLVRSVSADLPPRGTFFDVRPPPIEERGPLWIPLAGGTAALAGLAAAWLWRRRRARVPAGPDVAGLLREAATALERALAEPDARRLAEALRAALLRFAGLRFEIDTSARTAGELSGEVDAALVEWLSGLEHARFRPRPERDEVLAIGREARAWVGGVGSG
jgi:hypothetical protein